MSNNSRGITSLVNHLGDDRIKFQVVHNAMTGKVTLNKKGDETTFTMVTESENLQPGDFLTGKKRKVGLVLWIDPEDYAEWHKQGS